MTKNLNKKSAFLGVGYGAVVLVLSLMFMHVDLMETANHAYVLLDCIFSGRFLDFYNVVTEHANTLYYINGAHYSIIFYLIYAIWELPVWLINTFLGLPVNEGALWLWAKGPAVLAALGCGFTVQRIVDKMGEDGASSRWALLLNPVFVFFAVCAGQYDSIGLLFMLLALLNLLEDREMQFTVYMGIAVCCKFFALFLLVPVLLLRHKKLWEILKNLVLAVMPWAAVTLLYMGRTGNSINFTATVFLRLFEQRVGEVPLFPLAYVLVLLVCWLKPCNGTRELVRDSAYAGLAVFGEMMLLVEWHPQWSVLMVPFWVMIAALGKNKTLHYYLSLAVAAGVMLYSWMNNEYQFELNLVLYGILYLTGLSFDLVWMDYPSIYSIVGDIQALEPLATTFVFIAVFAVLAARLPLGKGGVALADRWSKKSEEFSLPLLWLVFGGCFAVFFGVILLQYLAM